MNSVVILITWRSVISKKLKLKWIKPRILRTPFQFKFLIPCWGRATDREHGTDIRLNMDWKLSLKSISIGLNYFYTSHRFHLNTATSQAQKLGKRKNIHKHVAILQNENQKCEIHHRLFPLAESWIRCNDAWEIPKLHSPISYIHTYIYAMRCQLDWSPIMEAEILGENNTMKMNAVLHGYR